MDWLTVAAFMGLAVYGWSLVHAAVYDPSAPTSMLDIDTSAGKQGMYILFSLILGAVVMLLDPRIFKTFSYPLYGFSIILLLFVMVYGGLTNGAMSWFELPGGFKLQPSEIAKFTTGLALATYLASNERGLLGNWQTAAVAMGIFILPAILVVAQGDPGTALVYMAMLIPLFREGLHPGIYILGLGLVVLLVCSLVFSPLAITWVLALLGVGVAAAQAKQPVLWWFLLLLAIGVGLYFYAEYPVYVLGGTGGLLAAILSMLLVRKKSPLVLGIIFGLGIMSALSFSVNYLFHKLEPHQQDRINVWLMPGQADKRGAYYNLRQSKLAIGSGGLTGKGHLKGEMTQGNHVPEQHTDFIFTVAGEEQGFLGVMVIIILYVFLLLRLTFVAERQRSAYTRIYAYGIVGIFAIHLLVNIGMTMGLMPVIGIPLPLMSYGGSSLVSFTLMVAVLLRFDSQRLLVFR